jgi:intein-encoded DNA endonuclease-like protein
MNFNWSHRKMMLENQKKCFFQSPNKIRERERFDIPRNRIIHWSYAIYNSE